MTSAPTKNTPYSTARESVRFFLLNTVTFGLYAAYWGWRRWVFVGKMENENFSFSLRGIFIPYTSFSLFGNFRTIASERTKDAPIYSPGLFGLLLLILMLTASNLGRFHLGLGQHLLLFVAMSALEALVVAGPTSTLVHILNNDSEARKKYETIGHNHGLIIFLALVNVLIMAGGAAIVLLAGKG